MSYWVDRIAALDPVKDHGRYAISNDDMLYVLSTFVYDPMDWIGRYGWRPLTEAEELAAFDYYREAGKRMGIRGIPSSFPEFWAYKESYEAEKFVYSDTNRRVGEYTVGLFAAWFPRVLRPMAHLGVRSMLDPSMVKAFGFSAAPRWVTAVGAGALKARGGLLGFGRTTGVIRPRKISRLAQEAKNRTYPGYPTGYEPGDLGAPEPPGDLDAQGGYGVGRARPDAVVPSVRATSERRQREVPRGHLHQPTQPTGVLDGLNP